MEHSEGRWDLTALYSGFDDPAFAGDIERLQGMMAEYRLRVRTLAQSGGIKPADLAELMEREEGLFPPFAASLKQLARVLKRKTDT